MLIAAVLLPAAAGVNVTLIVQLELAASALPQLFVWAKSEALVPEIEIPVIVRAAFPEFVRLAV